MGLTTPPRLGRGARGPSSRATPAPAAPADATRNRRMRWVGLLYLAPALAMYTWVVLVPLVQSANYSLYSWDGVSTPTWVGLGNYGDFFTDPDLRAALGHVGC